MHGHAKKTNMFCYWNIYILTIIVAKLILFFMLDLSGYVEILM